MGYTLKTLGAALWALWHSENFENGLIKRDELKNTIDKLYQIINIETT